MGSQEEKKELSNQMGEKNWETKRPCLGPWETISSYNLEARSYTSWETVKRNPRELYELYELGNQEEKKNRGTKRKKEFGNQEDLRPRGTPSSYNVKAAPLRAGRRSRVKR